ncbi:hypothetical protein ZIOFF_022283 [Zingiber officinale]|uniref:Integrase catalytic domain-containing protein n=1 Tax=Zingiber officinale TaxID=94328 RepID=A0A8J5HCR9_ZINOF|nr:hypothetical protein ZIOFF_022283 [Zingiber officinale]
METLVPSAACYRLRPRRRVSAAAGLLRPPKPHFRPRSTLSFLSLPVWFSYCVSQPVIFPHFLATPASQPWNEGLGKNVGLVRGPPGSPLPFPRWVDFVPKPHGNENKTEYMIKTLWTDQGGEFLSTEFTQFCENEGIERHLTAPYTPQQNGVVERCNHTMMAMARSLLKGANNEENVPKFMVVDAFGTDEVIVAADIEAAAEDVTTPTVAVVPMT